MQYYVVTFTHTKIVGWALHLHAHVKYLKKLIAEDKLLVSGPGVGTPVRSAQLVFKVTDHEELERLVAQDPYSIHGLVATKTENLWAIRCGSMEKPSVADPEGTRYYRATYKLPKGVHTSRARDARDAYLTMLLKSGRLRAAGPYVNDPTSGLEILCVADAEAADRIMRDDPYVKKLGATYETIEWDPRFGDFK